MDYIVDLSSDGELDKNLTPRARSSVLKEHHIPSPHAPPTLPPVPAPASTLASGSARVSPRTRMQVPVPAYSCSSAVYAPPALPSNSDPTTEKRSAKSSKPQRQNAFPLRRTNKTRLHMVIDHLVSSEDELTSTRGILMPMENSKPDHSKVKRRHLK